MRPLPANASLKVPGNPNSHGPLGLLGFAGLCLEVKHGVPELVHPFVFCHTCWDVLAAFSQMPDGELLGLVVWAGILVSSILATGKALLGLLKRVLMTDAPHRDDGEEHSS